MERYRSPFVGKSSPVHFFWGSFDLATSRYSGGPLHDVTGRPAGWQSPGNSSTPSLGSGQATSGCRSPRSSRTPILNRLGYRRASVLPDAAYFHPELGEFILPYDRVRGAADPEELVLDFYRGAYAVGAGLGGWDRAGLERPDSTPARRRPRLTVNPS